MFLRCKAASAAVTATASAAISATTVAIAAGIATGSWYLCWGYVAPPVFRCIWGTKQLGVWGIFGAYSRVVGGILGYSGVYRGIHWYIGVFMGGGGVGYWGVTHRLPIGQNLPPPLLLYLKLLPVVN